MRKSARKPFVITTGIPDVLGLTSGTVATERDGLIGNEDGRTANTHQVLALADRGVRTSVVQV